MLHSPPQRRLHALLARTCLYRNHAMTLPRQELVNLMRGIRQTR